MFLNLFDKYVTEGLVEKKILNLLFNPYYISFERTFEYNTNRFNELSCLLSDLLWS